MYRVRCTSRATGTCGVFTCDSLVEARREFAILVGDRRGLVELLDGRTGRIIQAA
jgi:hypothetical protein